MAKRTNRWLSRFCPWVYLSQRASNVKKFADNKLKSWLKEHVQIFKYCLQISKCTNDECCKPLRTNANDAFHNRFLPTPIALNLDPFLVDTVDKSEKCKIVDLYPL